ncbi:MAG TPA: sodium:proton antiporter, partial [Myxococcota bacterium]|nr:sodium:proton antiporter [Myxococcota bacterium]
CAFAVVLGTLVIQGLTLPALLRLLNLKDDDPVGQELRHGRAVAYEAALATLAENQTPLAAALRHELGDMLHRARGEAPADGDGDVSLADLRMTASQAARKAVWDLRKTAVIGDAAFHKLEEELDWAELTTQRGG